MKYFRTVLSTLAVGVVILQTIPAWRVQAVTAVDWRAGRIVDDGIFTNANDMSTSDIQAFLNSKVPSCDTNGTKPASEYGRSDLTHAQYAAMKGWAAPPYVCLRDYYEVPKTSPGPGIPANNYSGSIPAGAISAAQMIYDAAQQYRINPKVLLVKLGTESYGPLTSDSWPLQWQYTFAMGAHCPDSGPGGSANCDTNYAGFSIQMREAASLLRWYLDSMTQSWWQYRKPYQVNSISWKQAVSGCGAGNVYIESKATAALYTYTPYQPNQAALNNMYGLGDGCSSYGNRNFWRVFSDWFGSTLTPTYAAEFVSQGDSPWLKNDGESSRMQYSFKNVGIKSWYDEVSAWNASQPPVRLGTDLPLNRPSGFDDAWRLGATRPADTFAAVYESDGTTLATNQHIVQPGQIARFEFSLKAKTWIGSGQRYEGFRPIVEGWGPMWSSGNYYSVIHVIQSDYSYGFKGQSPYPSIIQSNSSPAWLQYQNTGNVAWYDEISAWNAGRQPVRLGTDGPINRISTFNDAWRLGATRPADTFAAVYESDGTTLATNQHIVQPGQIAKFSFNLRAPSIKAPGFYPEAFRPIVEGRGPMNGPGTWLGVTIP
jgi:hypothetical protein